MKDMQSCMCYLIFSNYPCFSKSWSVSRMQLYLFFKDYDNQMFKLLCLFIQLSLLVSFFWRGRESTDFLCSGKHHLSDFVVKNKQALLSKRRVPGSLSCLTKGIHHHSIPLVCKTCHWGRSAYLQWNQGGLCSDRNQTLCFWRNISTASDGL